MSETPERNIEDLANETIAGLDASYDLVYVDYRDQLTDKQVAALVRRDFDTFYELLDEFENDQKWRAVVEIIDREAQIILDSWEAEDDEDYSHLLDELRYSGEWERIREEIEDRDTGNWVGELASNSGTVLLRIAIPELDEDHAINHEPITAAELLLRLDTSPDVSFRTAAEADTHNLDEIEDALNNASPEFSLLMGFWVAAVRVSDLLDLPGDRDHVRIEDPHLYLGNPFMGDGYVTDEALKVSIRVKYEDLRTDKDAFGYSLDSIYGGLHEPEFEAEMRAAY